jgi:hypothetical protein
MVAAVRLEIMRVFVGKLVAPQKTLMFWRENRNGTKRAFQNMARPV